MPAVGIDPSAVMLDWIRSQAGIVDLTMSVCNGAFVLARAGLLDGKPATAHHGTSGCSPRTSRRFTSSVALASSTPAGCPPPGGSPQGSIWRYTSWSATSADTWPPTPLVTWNTKAKAGGTRARTLRSPDDQCPHDNDRCAPSVKWRWTRRPRHNDLQAPNDLLLRTLVPNKIRRRPRALRHPPLNGALTRSGAPVLVRTR